MKKTIKKVLLCSVSIFLFLVVVLAVHIYFVYRPAPDQYTKIMARIDIKQPITQTDAHKMEAWMYRQKGIDHVVVNPESSMVIFTFFPVKTTGNQVADAFKANFHVKADRFMPDDKQLASSCPVASTSYTYKIYKLITKII